MPDTKMKYVIAEIDWDNCYANLIAAFDDIYVAQEVLMEMWFEYQYLYFCEYLEYRWERNDILQEALDEVPSLRYCNLIIMEVPDCGS
ncbi:MAG: hypothetical protein IJZ40_02125 [Bacteroidaceae bacterium]|nr:hypothetical protein [Bacteroidaceae bacterium]